MIMKNGFKWRLQPWQYLPEAYRAESEGNRSPRKEI